MERLLIIAICLPKGENEQRFSCVHVVSNHFSPRNEIYHEIFNDMIRSEWQFEWEKFCFLSSGENYWSFLTRNVIQPTNRQENAIYSCMGENEVNHTHAKLCSRLTCHRWQAYEQCFHQVCLLLPLIKSVSKYSLWIFYINCLSTI